MSIDSMNHFGGHREYFEINFSAVTSLSQLPIAMQVIYEDVQKDATMASFICYCTAHNINIAYIEGRSGFSEKEIKNIVKEARDINIYNQLCNEFLSEKGV